MMCHLAAYISQLNLKLALPKIKWHPPYAAAYTVLWDLGVVHTVAAVSKAHG